MYAATLLTATLLAAGTIAAPSHQSNTRQDTTLSVQLDVYTGDINNAGVTNRITVPLYTLYQDTTDMLVSNISIVADSGAGGIDAKYVACQKYRDVEPAGTVTGSAEFTVAEPAEISTNHVGFGSVTCYVNRYSGN
ncbi:Uu.00g101480.m01.CDS01 [Anthostomella pinea]|uniref:Uu.00g101480.m01.CDS01 n=1 Tax=Anthostomella pinea TaxID=933095 RepID=A0AAI8VD98_9PEZI|nr:Uu.00g101480.m01.CDS01 [Anthostomella pinea]